MNRRNRTIIVVATSLLMASASSYLVYRTVAKIPVREVEVSHYMVVVAAKPLEVGTRLTESDVKLVAWPTSNPLTNAFSEIKQVVDRGLLAAVVENEPLTEVKLASATAGAGLSPTIPQGMRAMSVKVNEVVGVAGFVVPGTRVDVLATIRMRDQSMTRTVVSNVQVLTAGTRYDQEKAKDGKAIPSTVVTLMVSPADAERVALAQAEGQLMLALRNPLDTESPATLGAQTTSLLRGAAAVEAPAPPVVRKPRASAPPVPRAEPEQPRRYLFESIKGAKRATEELRPGSIRPEEIR